MNMGTLVILVLIGISWFIYLKISNNKKQKYLREQAEKGDAEAQYNLGVFLLKNYKLEDANNWLTKAYEQGYKDAKSKLSDCEFEIGKKKREVEEAKRKKVGIRGSKYAMHCGACKYYNKDKINCVKHGVIVYKDFHTCWAYELGTYETSKMKHERLTERAVCSYRNCRKSYLVHKSDADNKSCYCSKSCEDGESLILYNEAWSPRVREEGEAIKRRALENIDFKEVLYETERRLRNRLK